MERISVSNNLIQLFTTSFVEFSIPQDLLQELKQYSSNNINKNFKDLVPHNRHLVGAIEHEYGFDQYSKIAPYVQTAAKNYISNYQDLVHTYNNCEFQPETGAENNGKYGVWINFQKKGEYNPLHNHTGMLSFVLWINIPYTEEQEKSFFVKKRKIPLNETSENSIGSFNFVYVNYFINGGISNFRIPVDKSYEGRGILFGSFLNHYVNPFYSSDDYRISVAGNLVPHFN